MKFALADGHRVEAYPKGRATCLYCNGEVIAKCGTHRMSHWAHREIQTCDSWVEHETDWHRGWKNKFPNEWQEVIQHDGQSREKHVADVHTSHGLVIEFQHSHLGPQERAARERFYQNMVWVVDGTRLKRDYSRFSKAKDFLRPLGRTGYHLLSLPEECFPAMWLDSPVPVIFDFRGANMNQPPDVGRELLWCLFPGRVGASAVVVGLLREQFVDAALSRAEVLAVREILTALRETLASNARVARPFPGIPTGRGPRVRSMRL